MFRAILKPARQSPRIVLAFFLIATLPLLRMGWGFYAREKLNALASQRSARGLPGRIAQFLPVKKPDPHGVWNSLTQAGLMIRKNLDEHDFQKFFKSGEFNTAEQDFYPLAEQIESLNSSYYDQIHKAARLPSGNWTGQYKDPFEILSNLPDELDGIEYLVPCLCVSALSHMEQGDVTTALERLDDVKNICWIMGDEPSTGMVVISVLMDSYRHNFLNILAVKMKPEELRKNRDALERLIRELMDKRTFITAADRYFMQTVLNYFNSKKLNGMRLLDPLNDRLEFNCILCANALIDCLSKDVISKPALPKKSREISLLEPDVDVDDEAMNIILASYFTLVSLQQATATNLACQLYRLDHGRLPEALDQLVPVYIPRIPFDGCNISFKKQKQFIFDINIPQMPGADAPPPPKKIAYLPNDKRPALGFNMNAQSDPNKQPQYITTDWLMTIPLGETTYIDLNDRFLKMKDKEKE